MKKYTFESDGETGYLMKNGERVAYFCHRSHGESNQDREMRIETIDLLNRAAHLQHILEEVKRANFLPRSIADLIERLEKEGETR